MKKLGGDRDTTWLFAGITAAGGFGAGIGALWLFGKLPGDPLAFGGALFGAAAAVIGAEFVATRQKRADRQEARAYQYELLQRIEANIRIITGRFNPNPEDAHEFNKTLKAIDSAIRRLKYEAELINSPEVQKSAGWNVAIQHIPRAIRDAESAFILFDSQDIRNGHQAALAVAMAQAIGPLQEARIQVEQSLIDLKPAAGPPRR